LVVTQASNGRYRRLLAELQPLGDFRPTKFLGVILGQVENRQEFLEAVRAGRQEASPGFQDLGRVVPVDRVFTFRVDDFLGRVQQAVLPYLDQLAGHRFYVRLERRGHKGEIVSPEAERAIDRFIEENLELSRNPGQIDFTDPDAVVAIETIGDRAGVGLLTRELLTRYDFVRIA
ncbi:MAG: hypothetical protein IH614_07275, partial [Desulfuromonadales bacterium]|nr:hypothetical protein [Desulfuromonadales bacterium]